MGAEGREVLIKVTSKRKVFMVTTIGKMMEQRYLEPMNLFLEKLKEEEEEQ